jgi:hypothetical protein
MLRYLEHGGSTALGIGLVLMRLAVAGIRLGIRLSVLGIERVCK